MAGFRLSSWQRNGCGRMSLDNNRTGNIISINISGGGVPKKRVSGAQVSYNGLTGDAQDDRKHHGGLDKAVCLWALERIRSLQAEGHPIDIGTAGENVTIQGLDWNLVAPGAQLRLGNQVQLEVVSFTNPCKTIKGSFIDGKFIRIAQKLYPGWSRVYARVITEGEISQGDSVEVIAAPAQAP
jgi:MOSC domain-containing protein YiiM